MLTTDLLIPLNETNEKETEKSKNSLLPKKIISMMENYLMNLKFSIQMNFWSFLAIRMSPNIRTENGT